MADVEEDVERQTQENIRRTYDQLVHTRRAQLKYMANARRKTKGLTDLVTPDLVLQYNYVYQLMRSSRSSVPTDICVEDGGITCSNLSLSGMLDFPKPRRDVADGSDYLASRIVDLLDRPVTAGDQELTLNVRDEFAANIRTLNALFEERYRLCQEQSGRLQHELSTVRRQLVASRSAGAETATRGETDPTVRRMREKIAQYEVQLRTVREQIDALQEMNDSGVRRHRQEVEELMRRVHQAGRTEYGVAFTGLLQQLLDSMEGERDRVLAVVQKIQLANSRRSDEFSQLMRSREERMHSSPAGPDAGETEKRVRAAVELRIQNEMAKLTGDFDRLVNEEVRIRLTALEGVMRAKIHEEMSLAMTDAVTKEMDRRTEEMKRQFDDAVSTQISRVLGDSVPVVTSAQVSQIVEAEERNRRRLADTRLAQFKSALDSVLNVRGSPFDIVPTRPQYDLPGTDKESELMRSLYEYVDSLLQKLKDMHKLCFRQSGYLDRLGETAIGESVPVESMSEERTRTFVEQVVDIIAGRAYARRSQTDVAQLLERCLEELPKLRSEFENHLERRSSDRRLKETLKERDTEIRKLKERLRHEAALSARERTELTQLRVSNRLDQTTIRELQTAVKNMVRELNNVMKRREYETVLKKVSQGDLEREVRMRKELLESFRVLFDELLQLTTDLADEYKRFRESGGKTQQHALKYFDANLNRIRGKADSKIDYGTSPLLHQDAEDVLSGKHIVSKRRPLLTPVEESKSQGSKKVVSTTPTTVYRKKGSGQVGADTSSSRRKRGVDRWMN